MGLENVWNVELDILDVVDNICKENDLKYSIAYGTMLGAIRHKGFIPWDDDVDIIMPRNDYEKFLEIWRNNPVQGYVLQNKNTNWDFTQNFTKIRKDHTTFIHNEWEKHVSYHTGIFIDVFPGDRVAPNRISRKIQLLYSAINLLYARNHSSGSGGIKEIVEKVLLAFPKIIKKKLFACTTKYIQKWNSQIDQPFFFPNTMEWAFREYPNDMFDDIVYVPFEDRNYKCIKDADKILKLDYGNYLQLPPLEERVLKHHPIIMDTEHNLDEIE